MKTGHHGRIRSIPMELHNNWKVNGSFSKGIAIIAGKVWRGKYEGKYLACIDIDNKKGIEEFLSHFGEFNSLDKLAQKTIVEQHKDNPERAHIYFIVQKPLSKKSGIGTNHTGNDDRDNVPAIEVKSEGRNGTMIVTPSIHKYGQPYEIIGTKDIQVLDIGETEKLEDFLNHIYRKYSSTLVQIPSKDQKWTNISVLLSAELRDIAKSLRINNLHTRILKGTRSNTLISFGRTLLNYHYKFQDLNTLKEFFFQVNSDLCDPPLPEKEIEAIWNKDLEYLDRDLDSKDNEYTKRETRVYEQETLYEKISDKKVFEFIIKTIQKTVKQENSLIRLIAYCGLSAYTKYPLNLGIMASTSEGKTYSVNEVMKYFPTQDIWMIGSMSPRVIIRNKGIQVDENYNPIGPKVLELKKRISEEKSEEKKIELKEQLDTIINNSKILIDLTNKVLVFLEPPHLETWNILKPVLSHDTLYIEHPYVYQTKSTGQEVKHPITKGWPACIFCSAKDESNWPMWPEIQSRFLITSPNMIKKKYSESNQLIGQKKGLPAIVQSQVIVSDEEVSMAQDCMFLLKNELLKNKDNNVWIPFQQILSESLPSEKGPDVRMADKVFSLLVLTTKINSFSRPKLIMGNENLAISTPIDLEEVLTLTQNLTGIPIHKLEFFSQVFISRYKSKDTPDRIIKNSGEIIEEEKIALTTSELAEQFKKVKGKPITTDNINKTYLQELKNNGLIDEINSKIDGRRKIYYPIVDSSQFDFVFLSIKK